MPAPRRLDNLLILLAGLLAYCNSFTAPFIYDDFYFILDPRVQKHFWPLWNAFIPPEHFQPIIHRPLVTLSLAVNYALDGVNVWGYHVFNLGIHLLAGLTLLAVLRRTLARPLALAIALLWVVHPIHTESVTFIYQRAESLMGLFILLTLYGVIRCAEAPHSRGWKLFTAAVCAIGMMGKQGMAVAPVLALAYDRIFLSRSFAELFRLRGKLYAALAFTWLLPVFFYLTARQDNPSNFGWAMKEFTPLQFIINQPGVLLHYLRMAFWPHPLMLHRVWPMVYTPAGFLPPMLAVGGLLALTAWALRRRPALGFLGLAFFLLLAPACSLLPVGDPGADHRFYLALAPVLALAVLAGRALLPRRQLYGMIAAAALALTGATLARNYDYRSPLALWSDNVAKCPESYNAQSNLGLSYVHAGHYLQGIPHLKEALRLYPSSAETHYNLGFALQMLNRPEEADQSYRSAIQADPAYERAYVNLGILLQSQGRKADALETYLQALRLNPDNAALYNNIGTILFTEGKLPDSAAWFSRAVRLNPGYLEARQNLETVRRLERPAP